MQNEVRLDWIRFLPYGSQLQKNTTLRENLFKLTAQEKVFAIDNIFFESKTSFCTFSRSLRLKRIYLDQIHVSHCKENFS